MVILKEDALFKSRPKAKVNVKLRWISLFSKSSCIKTTASRLSYEPGVNGEKKVNGNWDIINKNGYSTFHTGKHESQCQKTVMVINILQMTCIGHFLEAPGPYQ